MRRLQHATLIAASLSTLCLLITSVILPTSAHAASIASGTLRVSPAVTNLKLALNQSSTTVNTTLTNLTGATLSVTPIARDFGALNSSGTISFYGKDYNPSTNPHGLQQIVHFPLTIITLAPRSSERVSIELNNVDKLAAGGHFGAILFSPSSSLAPVNKTNIAIHSSVASLIFLQTAKGGTQKLQLLPFSYGPLAFTLPKMAYVGVRNSGNTQTALRGQLTLYGPSNNIVATTVMNTGSGLVLPGTSRVFTNSLPLGNERFARPGMYHLELQYKQGADAPFTTVNVRFLYINFYIFIPVVLIIIVLIYGSRYGHQKYRAKQKRATHHKKKKQKK